MLDLCVVLGPLRHNPGSSCQLGLFRLWIVALKRREEEREETTEEEKRREEEKAPGPDHQDGPVLPYLTQPLRVPLDVGHSHTGISQSGQGQLGHNHASISHEKQALAILGLQMFLSDLLYQCLSITNQLTEKFFFSWA